MSADAAELRRAASAEREEWGGEHSARTYPRSSEIHLAIADSLDAFAAVWDGGGKYVFGSTEQRALAAMDEHEPDPTSLAGRVFALARLINGGAS